MVAVEIKINKELMNMKKIVFLFMVAFLALTVNVFGQSSKKSVEVLYFKANLACCKARACDALQADVDSVLIKYFPKENIKFNVVRLADTLNNDLIAKYNAKSQTVVVVKKKGKKEAATDVSAIVQDYALKRDKDLFENTLKDKISEFLK